MAFVRSWAEGLPLPVAWDRYLYVDGQADARRARGELQRLLDELRSLALAHGRPDLAALLRRQPEAMPAFSNAPMTLEFFREQQPADFYSEAELAEMYQARHGRLSASSVARRRQRLRGRLVAAVQWLTQVGVREPMPGDRIDAWLNAQIALHLRQVGIERLEELAAWINRHPHPWYRPIAKIGPERAARIARWWQEHAATLGTWPTSASPVGAAQPVHNPAADDIGFSDSLAPASQTGIVPLERFKPPRLLDGSDGANRALRARCKIAAADDHEAVQAWLRLRLAGGHTWRAYRKEAERFLLWSVLERHKALSSLDGDDCVAYRDFIAAPGGDWTGARHTKRWSGDWRPFEGALSAGSAVTALVIVRALCEWLVRRHYLDSNPWDDVPQRPDAPSMPQLRALSQRQWQAVDGWLKAHSSSVAAVRLRFLITFGYLTGLRLSELAAARVAWFRQETLEEGDAVWSTMVLGKRNRWREVPLPDTAVESFREYLTHRGLNPDILSNDPATPLLAQLRRPDALSSARIYELLVDAFERCADDIAARDPRAAERIRQATTHWLRHTHGSHAVAKGVPQDVLQANLGHQSLATTSIYINAEKSRRHRAVQLAFGSTATKKD